MARAFLDGFESGGIDLFGAQSGSNAVSTAGLDMDGSYCLEITGATDYIKLPITAVAEMYFARLVRCTEFTGGLNLMAFYSGGTLQGRIGVSASGNITAYVDTTNVASSGAALVANTSYFLEVYFKMADATGKITVKLNGITVIDYTGDTKPGAAATFDSITFGYHVASGGNSYQYMDNLVLDTAAWIGRTKIQGLTVSGAGSAAALTPSAGSNYACVDEVPASDADYVSTNTVDLLDTYAALNLSGTIGAIKSVQVQARAIKEGAATPTTAKLALKSGATTYLSAAKTLPTSYAGISSIWETDPATSAAWAEAAVNAIEIGVKSAA